MGRLEAYRNRALSEYNSAINQQKDAKEIENRTGHNILRSAMSDIRFWRNEVDRVNNLMLVHN